jgi:hypothetical protein
MLNCSPAATPVDTNAKLSATAGSPAIDASHYRSIVGGLQYLTLTHPELQYTVQQVCLYMHAPRDAHWTTVKWILRYIRGSMDLGLSRSPPRPPWTLSLIRMQIGQGVLTLGAPPRVIASTLARR